MRQKRQIDRGTDTLALVFYEFHSAQEPEAKRRLRAMLALCDVGNTGTSLLVSIIGHS